MAFVGTVRSRPESIFWVCSFLVEGASGDVSLPPPSRRVGSDPPSPLPPERLAGTLPVSPIAGLAIGRGRGGQVAGEGRIGLCVLGASA